MRAYAREPLARAANRLLSPLYLDLGGDHRDSVFVAGSGRSGTTWLSDLVNHRGDYRYVFEPFHPGRGREARPFGHRRYLRPCERRPELAGPASRILSGEVRGPWTDRFHRRFVARKRLIKDIRANLFLGWLAASFPGMPVVLILRHPCAVARSKTALGWRSRLEEFTQQPELYEDFLAPVAGPLRAARTEFERHVFAWCIESLVPLAHLEPGRAHLVFYERLIHDPEEELRRLFAYLGRGDAEGALRTLRTPSSLSRTESAVVSGGDLADGWLREVDRRQRRSAGRILALFGLDGVYGDSPMPDPDAAYRLLDQPWEAACRSG